MNGVGKVRTLKVLIYWEEKKEVSKDKKRIIGIDFLKIIACLGVVGLHTIGKDSSTINRILYYFCGYAIPIFFMVHGYLLLNKDNLNYKYLIHKAITFLYVAFLWNCTVMIIQIILHKSIINPLKETLREMIVQRGFFFQFWYFGALFLVYLVAPFLYKILHSSKRVQFGIILLAIVVIIDILSIYFSKTVGEPLQSRISQPFRIWTWIFYFYSGGLIKKLNIQIDNKSRKILFFLLISIIVNSVYDYFVGYKIIGIEWAEYFYDNIFMICESVLLFITFNGIKIDNIRINHIISSVSSLIMGVFVIHVMVIKVIEKCYNFQNSIYNLFLWFAVFLISLSISKIISLIPILKRLIKL